MPSAIDPTVFPDNAVVRKADMRQQFQIAKDEITALQGGSSISDAPADGHMYVRKDNAWVLMPVLEAPNDGNQYVRINSQWVALAPPVITLEYKYVTATTVPPLIGEVRVDPTGTAALYYHK